MKRVHYIDNYLIDPQHPVTVMFAQEMMGRGIHWMRW